MFSRVGWLRDRKGAEAMNRQYDPLIAENIYEQMDRERESFNSPDRDRAQKRTLEDGLSPVPGRDPLISIYKGTIKMGLELFFSRKKQLK